MNNDTSERGAQGRVFAVVGSTGRQGGATARALLAAGAGVRALTQDPNSEPARALTRRGAQTVRADNEDAASLRAAFGGVDGVFAMATFASDRGTEGEIEDGKAIAEAVHDIGVPSMVYSSVGGAERHTSVPHFESKRRVEEHIRSLGLAATFVRPTLFMDNFSSVMAPQVEGGVLVLRMPLPGGVPLQMIATDDIGKVATAILLDPGRVPAGSIEIAGDELTGEQIAAVHGERADLSSRYEPVPLDTLAGNPDQQAMFDWLARPPSYRADFAATRSLDPSVQNLAAWLAARD